MVIPTWKTRLRDWMLRFIPSTFKATRLPEISELALVSYRMELTVDQFRVNQKNIIKLTKMFHGAPDPWVAQLIRDMEESDTVSMLKWSDAVQGLPVFLDSPFTNLITQNRDEVTYTEWVLWYADDSIEILRPYYTSGWSNEDGSCKFSISQADPMPNGVVRAAQLTRGAFDNENGTYGVAWGLYHV